MTTTSDTTLSQPQTMVIASLLRGAIVAVAAAEAGGSRQMVSNWRNHAMSSKCR
jgi:hypothetical protein